MQPEEQTALAIAVAGRLVDMIALARMGERDRSRAEALGVTLVALAPSAVADPAAFVQAFGALATALAGGGDAAVVGSHIATVLGEIDIEYGFPAALAAVLAGAYCACLIRTDYPAQPDAAAARDLVRVLARRIGEPLGDALGFVAADAFDLMTGQTAVELSRIAASRAPLVRVETGISLPSTLLAWELYEDPERAGELVERNRVSTPMLMPVAIEALAR
jgi:hypothetical protein